jgi:hypothetical protein
MIAIMEAEAILKGTDAQLTDQQKEQIRLYADELIRLREAANSAGMEGAASLDALRVTVAGFEIDRIRQLGDQMGAAFGRAFEDMVIGAMDAKEALRQLALELQRILLRSLVTQPLGNAISGVVQGIIPTVISAKGNVFSGGNVVPFASGGVVDRPTMFPLRGNKTGLMGEAGPEAILPLTRGAGGKLGVKAESTGPQKVVNLTMNISTPDAGSFRKSRRQIAQDMRKSMNRA